MFVGGAADAAQVAVNGPADSGEFGARVAVLANGNFVVTDPGFDAPGPIADVGAVYLYRADGVLISTLRGSSANDRVGNGGTALLSNGNYVVSSPEWDNGPVTDAGAVTFGSGSSGISGIVSASNSLVGGTAHDQVGNPGVTALSNGNYVVHSTGWDNGAVIDAGAVTFGSGSTGIVGLVSASNSLVGGTAFDFVGSAGVTALSNGNYVVRSPFWDNGAVIDAGAATFGSGSSGISGIASASNSLVGGTASDFVGSNGVTALSNGNYVVRSRVWDNGPVIDAGAATFGSGSTGISGIVSASNSLVGGNTNDLVGNNDVTALSNGNYVVGSALWDDGPVVNAGAATFGSGSTGIVGLISASNSLVGSTANDSVGNPGVTALSNGNYVVRSTGWDNGAVINAGAATFGSGSTGIVGLVSASNSLVGGTANDQVSNPGVTALSNGNYVVGSSGWDNGPVINAGAATFGSGSTGIVGLISASNSLVGGTANDFVGNFGVTALSNGNYVVGSSGWDNGPVINAGAATFGSGSTGISGIVSASNSLVGSTANDQVGNPGVTALSNGNYVVGSSGWDNGVVIGAGAVTLGLANGSVFGTITTQHSVIVAVAGSGASQVFAYDPARNQLVVGQRLSNRVVLQRTGLATAISIVGDAPDPSAAGQLVSFTATVNASTAATDGQVRFAASSGESCTDTTPTATSPTTADFSCALVFTVNGTSNVTAEYTGSIIHAYSGSAPELHTTIIDAVFANGFEAP